MAESWQPAASKLCRLCSNISRGKLEEIKRQIKSSPEDKMRRHLTGIVSQDPVCTCDVKHPVYRLIKLYLHFLRKVKEDGIPRSCVWKSVRVFKSSFRSDVFSIVANLLTRGESLNYKTGVETPLMAAITTYDEQLLNLLLDFGADVNMSDGMEEMTALGLAILLNEVSLVELLLQHGGHANAACCGHLVPIQLAMNKNPGVSNILIQYGADVHFLASVSPASELFTINCPLVIAIVRKNTHLAVLLLEHGEDVNQAYGENLESPIHLAIREDDPAMIDILIQFKADLNRTSAEGHTPLGLALTLDQPNGTDIAKKLVRAGSHPNSKAIISFFQRIYTPLHIACFNGNFEFVRFLVEEVCSQYGMIGEEVEQAAGMSVQRMKKGFSVDRLLQERNPIMNTSADVPASRRSRLLSREIASLLNFDWRDGSRPKSAAHVPQMGCFDSEGEYWTRSEVAVASPSSSNIISLCGPCVPISRTGNDVLPNADLQSVSSDASGGASGNVSPSASNGSCKHQEPGAEKADSSAVNVCECSESLTDGFQDRLKINETEQPSLGASALEKPVPEQDPVDVSHSDGELSPTGDHLAQPGASVCSSETSQLSKDEQNPVSESGSFCDSVDNSCQGSELSPDDGSANPAPSTGASSSVDASPVFQDEFGAKGYDEMAWNSFTPSLPFEGEDDEDYLREVLEYENTEASQGSTAPAEEKKSWRRICFLSQRTVDGSTPLFMAVFSGNVQIVNYLLDAGASSSFECTHGNFFHAAVLSQNMTLVKKALELNCDINHINAFGNSPLILVSRLDMPEMCRLLVENGANMNSRDRFRETPLLASVYFGCESNARVLIQHGAALDLVDDNNTSAIYWAIFNNRERTLKLLLLAGVHFTPEILSHYPRNIRVMHNGPLYSWLRNHVSNPRSLRALSCLRVRKHLAEISAGRSIVNKIALLPLPTFLKDLLLLKDCFEAIDESCSSQQF